jgi:drug/metabolite transporter (DMT)-like permease
MIPELPWYVFALLSAACTPAITLLEKRGVSREAPIRFTTGVTILSALVSAAFLPFVAWESITAHLAGIIVLVAVFSALGLAFTAVATRNLETGEISSILALTPALTTLLAITFLNELPSPLALAGVAVIVLGIVILEWPRLLGLFNRLPASHALVYVGLGLLAVLTYALSALGDRIALASGAVSAFDFIVIVQVLMGIMFLAVALLRPRERFSFVSAIKRQPVTTLSIVGIQFLSRVLYSRAVALAYVGLVASLKRVNVVATILLAGRIFHERGLVRKLVSITCILAGVTAIIL